MTACFRASSRKLGVSGSPTCHAARIEPLPHQLTAVNGEMLPCQPLRFLRADDPGAGKAIMAGLLIKELMVRCDVERCLIVAPGMLVGQWQDELDGKFGLPFDILTREQAEASRSGNPFAERDLLIARLDVLSRNPDMQSRLAAAREWDLIVFDEAHRMPASFFDGEVKARHLCLSFNGPFGCAQAYSRVAVGTA